MSRSCSKIDQKQLFQELQTAIEEDKLYWIRNDAKIKASTTSKTYDEFRETVAAAHLNGVTKQDFKKKLNIWNTFAHSKKDK